ncbi:ubiquitin-protein ligase, putative [Ricinus communis]|uniref:Ubiquitin-protein ligase, putative n=1 Tax=Ricinus communis TaxID=3988 RepID=B9SF10_RICCO|nr:ubiquitin-protein ligase, putative [Ricinus communis]|eukprot:XP_002524579.1 F-box/LRR-repeat protein 12 [Ricinus communis]
MVDHSSDGPTSIMHLSDDCLSIIFQWLDCNSDRESFGLTCRRLLDIQNINRRSLQFQCSFTIFNLTSLPQRSLFINSFHIHRLLTRFQHLHFLSLSGCTDLPDSALIPLQFYGSRLHSLHLDCCFGLTDNGLSLITSGCPYLTVISLYRCNITDIGLETLANGCSALKQINLSYCPLVSDCGLRSISQACCQLQAVKISCCREISGVGFTGCSPTLAYIDAESCNLDPKGVMGIVSGGGLEYLNVSGISWSIKGDGLAAIGSGFAARLKILNLRMCRTVGDESATAIAKGCPLLQEWNLALCHGVQISGWESIGFGCNRLEKLHVNRCRNLCDRGLQALREGCKMLSVLYLNKSCRVSSNAIELFKLYRGNVEIREEEVMCIGPARTFR